MTLLAGRVFVKNFVSISLNVDGKMKLASALWILGLVLMVFGAGK